MSKQPGGQWSWLVRQVDSELDQAEKSLLLVGGTTGAEVGLPLVNVSHQRLQVRNRALRLNNSSKPRETHDSYQITSHIIPWFLIFNFNRPFFKVRPRPAADWLSDVSWARLSEMEDLGKGPWPGRTHGSHGFSLWGF